MFMTTGEKRTVPQAMDYQPRTIGWLIQVILFPVAFSYVAGKVLLGLTGLKATPQHLHQVMTGNHGRFARPTMGIITRSSRGLSA